MDIGSRDDVNSQKSAHINTPPPKPISKKPAPVAPHVAARNSRIQTERMFKYNSARGQGKPAEAAAYDAGVVLDSGDSLTTTEKMDLKFHGKAPVRRKRL